MSANVIRFTILAGLLIVGFMSGWKLAVGLWIGWIVVNGALIWNQRRKALSANVQLFNALMKTANKQVEIAKKQTKK